MTTATVYVGAAASEVEFADLCDRISSSGWRAVGSGGIDPVGDVEALLSADVIVRLDDVERLLAAGLGRAEDVI